MSEKKIEGLRCQGYAHQKRGGGQCRQLGTVAVDGRLYCYYHNPKDPKRFGEGRYHPKGEETR